MFDNLTQFLTGTLADLVRKVPVRLINRILFVTFLLASLLWVTQYTTGIFDKQLYDIGKHLYGSVVKKRLKKTYFDTSHQIWDSWVANSDKDSTHPTIREITKSIDAALNSVRGYSYKLFDSDDDYHIWYLQHLARLHIVKYSVSNEVNNVFIAHELLLQAKAIYKAKSISSDQLNEYASTNDIQQNLDRDEMQLLALKYLLTKDKEELEKAQKILSRSFGGCSSEKLRDAYVLDSKTLGSLGCTKI